MKKFLAIILAIIMVFALSVTALADFVPSATASSVTVDGDITATEWGTASFTGDRNTNWGYNAAYGWDFWQQTEAPTDEYYQVWLDHDDNYAYVAVKLTNSFGEDTCTIANDLWKHASLGFTLSAYDAATTVPRIFYEGNFYEQYDYWCMGLVNGEKTNWNIAQGKSGSALADSEYEIKYNDSDKSWSYEMAIPLSKTNITADTEGMVFSMDLRCPYKVCDSGVSSRYLTCKIAQNSEGGGIGANNFMHTWANPIIAYTDSQPVEGKVGDHASAFNNVVIDGNFSEEEWGEPVVITSPVHCQATWGTFWKFSPDYASPLQAIKVYVTNDEDNLYLAATLDHANWSDNCKAAEDLWKNVNFGFNVSRYDETNTVPHIEFGGDQYEQYAGFLLGYVNGAPAIQHHIQGMDDFEADYAMKYDEDSKTYIYEVKIPFAKTNIDLAQSKDIALACTINEPYSTNLYGEACANRANITTGYVSSGGANNFAQKNNALKITLNDPVYPEAWIGNKASEFTGNVKMDGSVTDEEYGKALISLYPNYAMSAATDPVTYWRYNPDGTRNAQNAKIYLTNDDKYIYVAATLDKANKETNIVTDSGALFGLANFGFSVARWDDKTTVPVIPFDGHEYEQYTAFRFGIKNGKPVLINMAQGIDIWEVPASDYAYKFDEAAGKYSYEIRVPLNKTNIDLYSGLDIAFSATLAQEKVGDITANAYQIDTGYASCGGPDNMAHDGHALKVTLNDAAKKVETWVLDTAPKLEGEIKIDGKIEENWGKAVVSTAPNHCQDTWGNFWQFDPASVNKGQNAKLYVTNDENYLYVGATIDECDFDETCTDLAKLYAAAHFGFSVSGYDKDNTVKHIPFEGDEYEQYTGFMMGFVNGKKASWTNTQGHAAWELPDEDYAINYDPETRTYTYECRLPFSKMNVTSTEIAISASIGTSYTGGDAANRYNITTGFASAGGAYNFAHKDNALHLNLAIVPNTGDNFNLFAVVAICAVALTACTALVIVKRKSNAK